MAGATAGLVASGRLALEDVSKQAKVIRVETQGHKTLGLIDAVRLEGDHVGNRMPFDPEMLRDVVLTRAEPAAIGMSPIGGLLLPCGADDDFGDEEPFGDDLDNSDGLGDEKVDDAKSDDYCGPDWKDIAFLGAMSEEIAEEKKERERIRREMFGDDSKDPES